MNREFPVSAGYKIFYSVVSIAMFGLGLFLFTLHNKAGFTMYLFPLLLMTGAISLIGSKLTNKVSIGSDSITQTSIFKTTAIPLAAITGYRITNKVLSIESVTAKIALRGYAELVNYSDLLNWLRENYKDLDAADYQADMQTVLNDTALGITTQDREAVLNRAKYFSMAYNMGGVILAVAAFILAESKILIVLLLIYPFLCIPVMLNSGGLIKFFSKKKSPYYSVFFGVYVIAFILLIKFFTSQYVLSLTNFWFPFMVTCAVLSGAIKFADRNNYPSPFKFSFAAILIISGLYAAGGVCEANCTFDTSAVQVYRAPVINHSITQNKGTHYHLLIGAWGPERKANDISVSKTAFYNDTIGSMVNVHLKQGFLHIPWYTVSE